MSDYIVRSVGSTNNGPLATEQGITRATALMHKVMEKRSGAGTTSKIKWPQAGLFDYNKGFQLITGNR